jgi:hypothetical protein
MKSLTLEVTYSSNAIRRPGIPSVKYSKMVSKG